MAWRYALDFEILRRVPSKFEDFRGEVFENGSDIDGGWREEL